MVLGDGFLLNQEKLFDSVDKHEKRNMSEKGGHFWKIKGWVGVIL